MCVHTYTPHPQNSKTSIQMQKEELKRLWQWSASQYSFQEPKEMITNEKFQILLIQENMSSFDNQHSHGINTSIFSSC